MKLHAQHVPKELRGKCTASRKPALHGWFLHRTCAFVRPSLSMGLEHDWQVRGHTTGSRGVKQNRLFVSNIRSTSLMSLQASLGLFPFFYSNGTLPPRSRQRQNAIHSWTFCDLPAPCSMRHGFIGRPPERQRCFGAYRNMHDWWVFSGLAKHGWVVTTVCGARSQDRDVETCLCQSKRKTKAHDSSMG